MILRCIIFLLIILVPSAFATEAIGFYSKGSLSKAKSIKTLMGENNIHKLFVDRNRQFGTEELLSTISGLVDFVRERYPEALPLQVGDLSNRYGGKAAGHLSHQNGLDIDFVYIGYSNTLQNTRAPFWEEEFVYNGILSSNFHVEKNFELFKFLVSTGVVNRIFVDRAVKEAFCIGLGSSSDPMTIETLRRIRPSVNHGNHFHLRVNCPKKDLKCLPQAEPLAGSGCDELLFEETVDDLLITPLNRD